MKEYKKELNEQPSILEKVNDEINAEAINKEIALLEKKKAALLVELQRVNARLAVLTNNDRKTISR